MQQAEESNGNIPDVIETDTISLTLDARTCFSVETDEGWYKVLPQFHLTLFKPSNYSPIAPSALTVGSTLSNSWDTAPANARYSHSGAYSLLNTR